MDQYGYSEVKFGTHLASMIKEYNKEAGKVIDYSIQVIETEVKKPAINHRHHKVIRRRKVYSYDAATPILSKGYWEREKRTLTHYHSNSLMFEYKRVG